MSRIVKVKRVAPVTAPSPAPLAPPAASPPVVRLSKGRPADCPVCGKKTKDGTNYFDCKDGIQRCDKCYKDYMKGLWKASGKQKKHNKKGGPRARFVLRFKRM